MKKLLILSLLISITCVHAMETEFNATQDAERAPEMLPDLQTKITQLRVTAQTLQQRVRGLPNHANFDLLSAVAHNKMSEHAKGVLLSNAQARLGNPTSVSSHGRIALCLEATLECLELAHEQTILSQAIENMESIITQHTKPQTSEKKSEPDWCELL